MSCHHLARRAVAAVATVTVAGLAGACGGTSKKSASSTTAAVNTTLSPAPTTTSVPATTAPAPTSPPSTVPPITTTSVVTTTTPAQPAQPTLGRLAGELSQGSGFGQVKPAGFSNGGDPTGTVSSITWSSWGAATATGTGTSDYVGPGQTVAAGTEEPATVVAFDLGTCAGQYMYQRVYWYYPQHGQTFNAAAAEDICSGTL